MSSFVSAHKIAPTMVAKSSNSDQLIHNITGHSLITYSPSSGNFCCQLITFANSLDPDQARQTVGPDLDANCLTQMGFLEDFSKRTQKGCHFTPCERFR